MARTDEGIMRKVKAESARWGPRIKTKAYMADATDPCSLG